LKPRVGKCTLSDDWTERVFDVTGKLVIDYRARDWCKLPYPGHPHGCPNYEKRSVCPPQAPRIEHWLDLSQPHWLVMVRFDLATFALGMKQKHPGWSEKQCRCLLYWQSGLRAKLLTTCKRFQQAHPGSVLTLLPEAMGVHVMNTARKLNVPIRPRLRDVVYKVALVGYSPSSASRSALQWENVLHS